MYSTAPIATAPGVAVAGKIRSATASRMRSCVSLRTGVDITRRYYRSSQRCKRCCRNDVKTFEACFDGAQQQRNGQFELLSVRPETVERLPIIFAQSFLLYG